MALSITLSVTAVGASPVLINTNSNVPGDEPLPADDMDDDFDSDDMLRIDGWDLVCIDPGDWSMVALAILEQAPSFPAVSLDSFCALNHLRI